MRAMRNSQNLGWAKLLILGLLFLRALVPAGFMLAQVDSGIALVLCDAAIPAGEPQHQHHHHGHDTGTGHDTGAGHDSGASDDSAAGHAGAHGDPTCPYAQNAGPAPLSALPVIAGAATVDQLGLAPAVTQTFSIPGPTRQQTPRGPPSLA